MDEKQKSGVGNEEEKNEVEEGQIVEGWKEVTPEKSSRSAKSLQHKPLHIYTTSRFAVLSNSKEDEGEDVQEKEESLEVSDKEIEEDSSEEDKSEMEEVKEKQGREILPRQSKLKHKIWENLTKRVMDTIHNELEGERSDAIDATDAEVALGTSKKNRLASANANALKLSCELLKSFVSEAVQRAAIIAEAEGMDKIEASHLERILPQLLLDF
ncbi:hypothetical protein F2Q68_00009578 [Brassica cretica]|uniref:Centromere protein X n=1 Tax=Brassica cretica TaxID=69181 RepID=A0A8S9L067_BRACR|nr:hypothetical protein F2Q68_00009578 [Brassica cretica]